MKPHKTILIALFILIVLSYLAASLSFTSGPLINGGLATYTEDDLFCTWSASGDATSANVSWYKNGALQYTFEAVSSPSTLEYSNTTKTDEWICEVKLINSTDTLLANVSATISNTAPTTPILYNATRTELISYNFTLVEDTTLTFFINSSDADNDALIYSLADDGAGMCTVVSSSTGEISCTPTHAVITGSSEPGSESSVTEYITPVATASDPYSASGDENRSFYLVPINDQAGFYQNISNVSIVADNLWMLTINGTDEESNTNYSFTLGSTLNAVFGNILILETLNETTANITFNNSENAPLNTYGGNWTVYLNITDSAGSNATRPPTQHQFNIEILATNHAPEITTNLSVTNGTQGLQFEAWIFANDTEENDTLTFAVSEPAGPEYGCSVNWPWNITTLNSSSVNASGLINLTLTNDHIACRYINITVSDPLSARDSLLLFINLTNVNDPPYIDETGVNGNISIQTTHLYVPYQYQVNATDNDSLTYDENMTANLTYTINHSDIFSIAATTGLFSVTALNDSYLGNWSINVSVSDGEYQFDKTMNLEIINNTAPVLSIASNNLIFNQSDSIVLSFTGEELNNETMVATLSSLGSFSASTYNASPNETDYSSGTNLTMWQINLTKSTNKDANDLVGIHSLFLNLTDIYDASREGTSTGTLNFTISNENDAPFFDRNFDNMTDTLDFGTVVVNKTFSYIVNATDYDLWIGAYANESLTFNYSVFSSSIQSISLTKTSSNSALLSFNPTQEGTYSLLINVNDTSGANATQNVSFTVYSTSTEPVFQSIKPYFNTTTNITVDSFADASTYPSNQISINASENTSVVFDAIVTNDTSVAGNQLTYRWYVDSNLNETIISPVQGIDSNYTLNLSFFSAGRTNITLVTEDSRYSNATWRWFVNVTNHNRPPVYNAGTLQNLTVNRTTEFSNYFSYRNLQQRFYDPDDDLNGNGIRSYDFNESTSLTYTVINANLCSLATFTITNDSLSVRPAETGICALQFNASDPYGRVVTSDTIYITVVGAEPSSGTTTVSTSSGGSSTRTQVVTVPLEEEVDSPVPIKILAPDTVTMYINKTIQVPIVLENTWTESIRQITLSGVTLNATFANENNVSISFSETNFPAIPVGQRVRSIMTIRNYRSNGPFEISVFAHVSSPEFTDSATVLINALEQSSEGEEIKSKVTFAKDMLSENSECRELNDLLSRAEQELVNSNYEESLNLVNAVINGCKFLINKNEIFRKESPSVIDQSFDFVNEHADKLIIGAGVLIFLVIIIYVAITIKHMMLSGEGRKEK